MAKALAALTLWLCIAAPAFAAAVDKKQPIWSQLRPEQQQILAPLSTEWDKLDDIRRKKWLLLAKRYPKMKPEQQQRLQTQMQDWAKLTPAQRAVARDKFLKLAKEPPEKREAVKKKWTEYQRQKQAGNAAPAKSVPEATASDDKSAAPVAPASLTR